MNVSFHPFIPQLLSPSLVDALQLGSTRFAKRLWILKYDSFLLPLQKSQSSFEDQQLLSQNPSGDVEANSYAKSSPDQPGILWPATGLPRYLAPALRHQHTTFREGVGSLPGADSGHRADGKCFSWQVRPIFPLCLAVRGLLSKEGSSAHPSHLFRNPQAWLAHLSNFGLLSTFLLLFLVMAEQLSPTAYQSSPYICVWKGSFVWE